MRFLLHNMGEAEYGRNRRVGITNLIIYKQTKLFTTVEIIN